MCTIVTYAPDDPEVGGGDIGYSSKKETPEGRFVNATGDKSGIIIYRAQLKGGP